MRADSLWDVPEPELVLVIGADGGIVGYTTGNDVSSRSIEGENPLYLPQAKVYDGSCAIGPGIRLCDAAGMRDLAVTLDILRDGASAFSGGTRTSQIKRGLEELAGWLLRELRQPGGVFLFTGTGIVPGEDFTLRSGDVVRIDIDGLTLENPVSSTSPDLQPICSTAPAPVASGSFHARNPTTGEAIVDHHYPISGWGDIEAMLEAGGGGRAARRLADLAVSSSATPTPSGARRS